MKKPILALFTPVLLILALGSPGASSAEAQAPAAACIARVTGSQQVVRYLTLDEVVAIHSAELAEDKVGLDTIRDRNAIESAVMQPQATFGGADLHPGLFEKAATYAFAIAESQGFTDGNKRAAANAALKFLELNGYPVRAARADSILHSALVDIASKKITREDLTALIERLASAAPKRIRYVTVNQALAIHRRELAAAGGQIEGVRDMGIFTSAILRPQGAFAGQDLYPTVFDKAAAYLYFIAEAQAFLNGNKRVAISVALEFLKNNGHAVTRAKADPVLKKALLDIAEKRIAFKDLAVLFQRLAQ